MKKVKSPSKVTGMHKSRQKVESVIESYHRQSEVLKGIKKTEKELTHLGIIGINARVKMWVFSTGLVILSIKNVL